MWARFLMVALLLGACKPQETPFPEGLEPLEENTAPLPEPRGGEEHPEELRLLSGDTADFAWTHARGYVHAQLPQVWAALRVPAVCVDRREVDEWSVDVLEDPEVDFSYVLHNTVFDVLTVEFDVTWRHGAVGGTVSAPEQVAARFQKTFGSDVIALMEGSIVLLPVAGTSERVEVQFIEHLKALLGGTETTEAYLQDLFTDLVAQTHGQQLPSYP